MVNNYGQLYTIEGIAAGILMLTTAYLVLSTTSIYTPAETHISDMQLEQLGNDVLDVMDTPYSSMQAGGGTSEISQYIENNQKTEFAIRFNNLVTTKGAENVKFRSTVWYRDAAGIIQRYIFTDMEDIGVEWTLIKSNDANDWSKRASHSSVAMPDGSIVLIAGNDGNFKSDVWRSKDYGSTWTQMTAGAGWSARASHSSVVMPDGSIILMGGQGNGGYTNDVWRSTDNGATWTQMTAGAGWSARASHSSVAMPDGSIVLMGGQDSSGYKNDMWRSIDKGSTWTEVIPMAGPIWSVRSGHSSVVMPEGDIVLMGGGQGIGIYMNDVWRLTLMYSPVVNVTYTPVKPNDANYWSARATHSSVVMPDGRIVLMGGQGIAGYEDDVWRSTDNGATWTQAITDPPIWSDRKSHSSVVIQVPPGNIVMIALMGGQGNGGYTNDVWRSISKPIITNRERMVTISRLVQIEPPFNNFILVPFDNRDQVVLMEVSLWRD